MAIFTAKMAAMYTRTLSLPNYSFFLFGPRSTGKTTWLRTEIPNALWFNLLRDAELLPLMGDPTLFRKQLEAYSGGWVVLDEVQKYPALLNEIHDLMTTYPDRFLFALSGSSARKLRRQGVNLLAGRAIQRQFYPLTRLELGPDFSLARALDVGTLPLIVAKPELSQELLIAYVGTYLKEEIQQEALVEDIGSFHRFLTVAALLNGTTPNISSVSRDVGVARKTVERYFDILIDTLVAFWLPAWKTKARVKEVSRPKFYFFDCGIVRAIRNRLGLPATPEEQGILLETYMLHEIRAYLNLTGSLGELSYWNAYGESEVDIIWRYGETVVGIEIKSSREWRREYGSALKRLHKEGVITKAFGIYGGDRALNDDNVVVFPVLKFLDAMTSGEVFS